MSVISCLTYTINHCNKAFDRKMKLKLKLKISKKLAVTSMVIIREELTNLIDDI